MHSKVDCTGTILNVCVCCARPQLICIGPVSICAVPFEVLSDFALTLKAAYANAVVVSAAGGYEGYLPLQHEFARGGYEVEPRSTYFVPGTGDKLLSTVMKLLATSRM